MMRPLAWPVRYGPTGMATIHPDEAPAQRAGLLLATKQGERPDAPDFGLADPLGRLSVPLDGAASAISRYDPGVHASLTPDPVHPGHIQVEVHP